MKNLEKGLFRSAMYLLVTLALITFSEITNSMSEVLERHWRWHVGKDEKLNIFSIFNVFKSSLNPMLVQDFKANDFAASLISMIYPFFSYLRLFAQKQIDLFF